MMLLTVHMLTKRELHSYDSALRQSGNPKGILYILRPWPRQCGQVCARVDQVCAAQALEGEAKSQEVAADEVKAEPEQGAAPDGRKMVLDWKGDPMYINPGDKLPF